ncbi:MAG: hypothetical protein HKN85_04355 [Gammaproteobacteria bacterium]|nr:hypothetical protein [Gammaproteobacteria bacterium]
MSLIKLSKQAGLTTTSCIERVRKLELDGSIHGCTA